jgi:5'-methylthioadenosine phosphorylase
VSDPSPHPRAEIGILGGSGFYELLDDSEEIEFDTPFGAPSEAIAVGTFAGRQVAFLARHGRGHRIPPHGINYRANLYAMRELGVTRIVSPNAVGSLKPDLGPGTFVVLDQFVDRTRGREDTFYGGADGAVDGAMTAVTHVSMADPYCPELRGTVVSALTELQLGHQDGGTIVVINGPRFSTRAESRWFSAAGWDVVGMTQYPEAALARELALCFTGVSMVTDYDVGLEDDPDIEAVTTEAVMEVFASNIANVRRLLELAVAAVPVTRGCACSRALDGARL